ncbi:MAG: hypothetical protein P1V97_14915, partial [Planctomycetota bacterium]|nr:hypothetical protein [Planctomycetota bacterium]
ILRHRITVDPSPPKAVAPELGRDLSDFIMALLVRNRDQRLSDSHEVVAQLAALCERYPANGRSQRPPTKRFDGGPKSRVLRRRKAKSGRAAKAPLMNQTIPVHQYQQAPEKPKIPVAKKVTGPVFEPLVTLPVDEVGRGIQDAEAHLEQGRFDLVQAKIGELELSYGGDERVDDLKAQLKSLQVLVEDNLEQARSRCGKGRYDDAMAFLLAAAQKCPSHPEVNEELRKLEKQLKERDERLIQAEEALKKGQKEEWQRQATDMVSLMPKDARVLEFVEESERFFARIDTLKVKAAADATAKNFADAAGRMERALNLSPSDSVLKQLKEQYEREVIRQSNRSFQGKLLVGGGVAFVLCILMVFLLQRRAEHLLTRSQLMLDQGHPKTALKDYENSLQPVSWFTSASVREELKMKIDGHLAYETLGESLEKPAAKVAAFEEFQQTYPGVKDEDIKVRLVDARRDLAADERFDEICDLDVVEKVKQLRVFLANDKFLRNKQEARQILQSILRRRQAALERAAMAEKNQQWIEARDALKDAVAYGAVDVDIRLAKVSRKAEKLDVILIQAAQALASKDYDAAIAHYKTAQKLGANVSQHMKDLSVMRYKAEAQQAKYRYDYAALVRAYKNLRDAGGTVKRYDWDYAHEQDARARAEKHKKEKRYQEAIAAYKEATMFTRRSNRYQYQIGYIERLIKLDAERKARSERYKKRRR